MDLIRKNDCKQIKHIRRILRGNPPIKEEQVWYNDYNEEKVWDSLKWCAIWAIVVFIICCLLAVVKIS
jgi:hypothetical protein